MCVCVCTRTRRRRASSLSPGLEAVARRPRATQLHAAPSTRATRPAVRVRLVYTRGGWRRRRRRRYAVSNCMSQHCRQRLRLRGRRRRRCVSNISTNNGVRVPQSTHRHTHIMRVSAHGK